jgi:chromosome condensin MukBEF ATPase and DNA-binding subunit MukB
VVLAPLHLVTFGSMQGEERHKKRIQELLKQLAEEREAKEEALRQVDTKQGTIDFCATEIDKLTEDKKDLGEQLDVKQVHRSVLPPLVLRGSWGRLPSKLSRSSWRR